MDRHISRRQVLKYASQLSLYALMRGLLPVYALSGGGIANAQPVNRREYDLSIAPLPVTFNGSTGHGVAINGTIPGPLLRFQEGDDAYLRVTNRLDELTSIHWHGILLPAPMDGVPGVSFAGIAPQTTFDYRFPVRQNGTYWYHSHSGGQEQLGVYGPIIIDPREPEPFRFDRDYVVMLSDWTFEHPMTLLRKLKQQSNYFNDQRLTLGDLLAQVAREGCGAFSERLMWSRMRMDPTDILDVTGATYTYLLNGMPPSSNWTGLFRPGERVRLRFIDAGAQTIFDLRIPGLKLTVVQADGQYVRPVVVDELRIAPGETYDVLVEPTEDRAYTIFAEPMDRSGYAMGTLAPRAGMRGPMPERRKRPLRTMADMGMSHAGGMPGMLHGSGNGSPTDGGMGDMPGMDHGTDGMEHGQTSPIPDSTPVPHGPDNHGPGNAAVPDSTRSRLHEPGVGLEDTGTRVLVYTDLKSPVAWEDQRPPEREIEIHLTGNMDRFMWSIDGKKYSEAPMPIPFRFGERLRLTMVNDTMMEHPMHLHGMWMYPENGAGPFLPRKHTLIVKPAERVSVLITADAPGRWSFHCHMLLHMEMGMFRVVEVRTAQSEGGQ